MDKNMSDAELYVNNHYYGMIKKYQKESVGDYVTVLKLWTKHCPSDLGFELVD